MKYPKQYRDRVFSPSTDQKSDVVEQVMGSTFQSHPAGVLGRHPISVGSGNATAFMPTSMRVISVVAEPSEEGKIAFPMTHVPVLLEDVAVRGIAQIAGPMVLGNDPDGTTDQGWITVKWDYLDSQHPLMLYFLTMTTTPTHIFVDVRGHRL